MFTSALRYLSTTKTKTSTVHIPSPGIKQPNNSNYYYNNNNFFDIATLLGNNNTWLSNVQTRDVGNRASIRVMLFVLLWIFATLKAFLAFFAIIDSSLQNNHLIEILKSSVFMKLFSIAPVPLRSTGEQSLTLYPPFLFSLLFYCNKTILVPIPLIIIIWIITIQVRRIRHASQVPTAITKRGGFYICRNCSEPVHMHHICPKCLTDYKTKPVLEHSKR